MSSADLLVGVATLVAAVAVSAVLRSIPARFDRMGVLLVVAAAAVAMVPATSSSTGSGPAEVVWRLAIGAVVAAVAVRCDPAALLVVGAVVAATASPGAAWLGFAAIGLAASTRSPAGRAAAGALLAGGLLHLGWPQGHGATTAVAFACALVLVGATDPTVRRRAAATTVVLLGAGGLAVGGAAAATAGQRRHATAAIDAAQRGLDAAREGRSGDARRSLDRAADILDDVRRSTRSWYAAPARAVPIVGANLLELDRVVDIATEVARTAATAAEAAKVDQVTAAQGRIDLEVLGAFADPLDHLARTLGSARRRLAAPTSPWLVSPLRDRRHELGRRVTEAAADTRRARRAVAAVPRLLGGAGRRRYLLAVMTPAELRGGGGLVGNWGLLEAEQGAVSLPRFGRIKELFPTTPYRLSVDADYNDRYVRRFALATNPQNLLGSPDLAADAAVARQIAEQAGLGAIDGLIVVDPIAMAGLLRLTGPIDVEGWGQPLTADNVARSLLFDQYQDAEDPTRPGLLARTTNVLFDHLTTGTLPSPRAIADALGPAVEGGDLRMVSLHHEDQAFLATTGLTRPFALPAGDGLRIVGQNANSTKLDWFLRRSITYDLRVQPDGRATGTVDVVLRNTAPRTGLPTVYYRGVEVPSPVGTELQMTSLYSPLDVTTVTVDGAPQVFDRSSEKGYGVYDRFVPIPPRGEATLRYEVSGRLDLPGGDYHLRVGRQPTVVSDDLLVRVNGRVLHDGPLRRDLDLRAPLP